MHTLNPLCARVGAIVADSGMVAATVDSGYGEPALYPGYLSTVDALAAGARFAEAIGRRPIMPEGFEPTPKPARDRRDMVAVSRDLGDRLQRARDGRHGADRRRERRAVRAAKLAWLNSRD